MNIDPDTGTLNFPEIGISITPTLTHEEFVNTPVFSRFTPAVHNLPYRSYFLPRLQLNDSSLDPTIYFTGEIIDSVHLAHGGERFGLSWSDWSEEKELARKSFHEKWLKELNAPAGKYPWGEIFSVYDAKAGAASIIIRYEKKALHLSDDLSGL